MIMAFLWTGFVIAFYTSVAWLLWLAIKTQRKTPADLFVFVLIMIAFSIPGIAIHFVCFFLARGFLGSDSFLAALKSAWTEDSPWLWGGNSFFVFGAVVAWMASMSSETREHDETTPTN